MREPRYMICWICGNELYGDLKHRKVHIETCYLASLKKRRIAAPVFPTAATPVIEQPLLPFPLDTDYSVS